jgi:hypothetical protein
MAAQLALALTDDSREVLPTLSLLFRACQLIGEDPVVEFRASAHAVRASPDGEFMKFLDRSPEDQSIGAMGFEEGNDAAGFRFQRNW